MFIYEYTYCTCLEYDDIDVSCWNLLMIHARNEIYDDLNKKLMISTCVMIRIWLIMLLACLVSLLGMILCWWNSGHFGF